MVGTSTGDAFRTNLKPEAEARFRVYYEIDQNRIPRAFSLRERDGRIFTYDVSNMR